LPNHIIGSLLRKHFPGLAKPDDDHPPSPGLTWEHYQHTKDEHDVTMATRVIDVFFVSIFATSFFHIQILVINCHMLSCREHFLAWMVRKRRRPKAS
jgi:hypothetical protein